MRQGTLLLFPHHPISVFYQGVYFCHTMAMAVLAPSGAIITAVPNLSANTSSRGHRQCRLRLVFVDSSGGASSIVLTHLVHFFLFYFSAAPPSHPFHPACIDHRRAPSPSCFPSPLSLLLQHICCIALALPVLVRRHCPLSLASSTLVVSVPLPPPPPSRYFYLLAIAGNVRPSH